MAALNVLPADCLTRVSEYCPEIVDYIAKYAYSSSSSSSASPLFLIYSSSSSSPSPLLLSSSPHP